IPLSRVRGCPRRGWGRRFTGRSVRRRCCAASPPPLRHCSAAAPPLLLTIPDHMSSSTSALPFSTTERVRFEDVDLVGIMRYSATMRFMDVAAAELFRKAGVPLPQVAERFGMWLPRKVLHVEYLAPAKW